jgi:hypothetical protein
MGLYSDDCEVAAPKSLAAKTSKQLLDARSTLPAVEAASFEQYDRD